MDRMQKRLDAMEKLRREIDDLEEELLTAKRRWKNSSETLRQLTEEKQRKAYRLSQFEEIMKKTGLIDGYDPDELYLVLLTNLLQLEECIQQQKKTICQDEEQIEKAT
ncbi:hypothetical protein [uncultured Mitsuokella sp.]|uniref:hypothetical protein n=1 Tax=uncultured Mitsuokella sp. TaxID=453120 RepID=UPI002670209A|nr:hypothetical protein [uncultured Mitsuokella sp.]